MILFHCFSLISCRFMNPILSFQRLAHNIAVLKQTLGMQIALGERFLQGKADDTSGLTPTKDDNEALQKSGPSQMKVPDLVEY